MIPVDQFQAIAAHQKKKKSSQSTVQAALEHLSQQEQLRQKDNGDKDD